MVPTSTLSYLQALGYYQGATSVVTGGLQGGRTSEVAVAAMYTTCVTYTTSPTPTMPG